MKLQVKLSVLIGIVFTSGSLIINGSNSIISKREAIRTQDKILNDALDFVRESPTNDVSEVLVFSETSPAPISATLYFDDSQPVVLIEGIDGSRVLKIPNLEVSEVASATKTPLNLNDENSMRISSYSIGNGEWLIVGLSVATVNQEFSNAIGRSFLLTVIIALLMTLLVRFLISRALRPIDLIIEDAKKIATGSTEIKLRTAGGNDEISRLTHTLDEMLGRIQKAVKSAKDSETLMKEFMGDASHELRSPLTVIRGYVDILAGQQTLSDEQRERAIYRLKSESFRMSKTIDDLLILAEIGEVEIRKSDEVDLTDLVTEFVEDFKVRNPGRSVHQNIDSKVTVPGNSEQL
ncbi:MAG: sensor histidine kinase, partial [Actinobacteria bacterium]|nr:sensor histidine kinase [Actinomycetota bacterium]